jgi:hypothetical protein
MGLTIAAERALRVDIKAMIYYDYKEAGKKPNADIQLLRARLLTAIENGQAQSRAIAEHRRAWRETLGLPPLC